MKKLFRSLIVVLFVSVSVFGSAMAADTSRFSCSVWTSVVSKSLFFFSGIYATNGPALLAVPECVDNQTGFYGNLFLSAPLRDFDTGKEIDVRIGKRFKAGGLDIDSSIADYYFGIGPGSKNLYNNVNGRVRISHTFDLGNNVNVQPYGIADVQRNFTPLRANAFAFVGGAVIDSKLNWAPGKPYLTVDLGGWKYMTIWTPNKGPILAAQVSLAYEVNKGVTIGPRFVQTRGNVSDTSRKPDNMWGAFAVITF